MSVTLEQIEGSLRSYKEVLERNSLTSEEREECQKEIEKLELMKKRFTT